MKRSFEEHKERFKRELARRLGPMLPDIPAEDFEELIDRMATLQCRYDIKRLSDDSGNLRQR